MRLLDRILRRVFGEPKWESTFRALKELDAEIVADLKARGFHDNEISAMKCPLYDPATRRHPDYPYGFEAGMLQ